MTREKESPKGIISPWSLTREEPAQTVEEQLREKMRPGRTPVAIQGRQYHLLITLPISFKRDDSAVNNAKTAAMHVFGEFLSRAATREFIELLAKQKLSLKEEAILGPRVIFELGPVKLYAAASSHDAKLAQAMAVDRLALVLTQARLTIPNFDKLMAEHYLDIVRKTT
jgi:hypothetical protein